jgi:hypothetical protein
VQYGFGKMARLCVANGKNPNMVKFEIAMKKVLRSVFKK